MKPFRKLSDSISIDELIKNIGRMKEIPVWITLEDSQFYETMYFNYKTGDQPMISSSLKIPSLEVGSIVEINFFYKENLFFFKSAITGISEKYFNIKKPDCIQFSYVRRNSRYKISDMEDIVVVLRDRKEKYGVYDISASGLSFKSDEKLFNEGYIVRNICLIINNTASVYFDGVVRYVKETNGAFKYGVSFLNLEWNSNQLIFNYLFEKKHPGIRSLVHYHIEEIGRLYDKSRNTSKRLFDYDNGEFINDVQNLEKTKDKPMISTHLVYQKNGKILGVGSALRVYDRTFLAYQPLLVPDAMLNAKAKTDIYLSLSENLLNHPYFEYLITYINTDFEWYQSTFGKIGMIIDDHTMYKMESQQLFDYRIGDECLNDVSNKYCTEVLDDPAEFIEYCKTVLPALEIESFAYNTDRFSLSQIKELYSSLGLFNARKLFCTKADGKVCAFSVAECLSNGTSLKDNTDTVRIYLKEHTEDIEKLMESILCESSMFYRINNKNRFNVMLDLSQKESENISVSGLYYNNRIDKVIMSREGLIEFSRLLTSSFENYTKFYPLTQPQKSIWFTEKVFQGTSIGNIIGSLKIRGEVDFSTMEKAVNLYIEKNDGMRIRLIEENDEPRQYVWDYKYFNVDLLDFSHSSGLEEYYKWDDEHTQKAFEIYDSPLYYFALVKLNDYNVLYVKNHHLISDAWTINLLGSQIIEYYDMLIKNVRIPDFKKPSYMDFVLEEEEYRYSDKFEKNKSFWNDKFKTMPEFTSFQAKQNMSGTRADRKTFIMPKNISEMLGGYCKSNKISAFSMFMSVFSIYISKITGCEDIVIGTPVLNRSGAKEKDTAGMFISSIPVRLFVSYDMDYFSYLGYVTKEINNCFKNQKYNYDMILNDYRINHQVSKKLYDVVVSYQNAKYGKPGVGLNYEARWHFNKNQVDSLVLHIDDREDQGQYLINFDYLTGMFTKEEIELTYARLMNIFAEVMSNPEVKISQISAFTEEERLLLLKTLAHFNDTKSQYPKDKSIQCHFEEQAKRSPDSIALVFEGNAMTYRELNEKSNKLARFLRESGVKRDSFVGIMADKSFELIVGILSILKSGAAYLPIVPEYPKERINLLIRDCDVKLLLSRKSFVDKVPDSCTFLDLDSSGIYSPDATELDNINSSADLAYIIFTSGSTGKPKGVMIEHKSLVNQITGLCKKLGFDSSYNHILLAQISFDVSVQHIFTPLITGAKLFIPDDKILKNHDMFWAYVYDNKIDVINTVPAFLDTLLDNRNITAQHKFKYIMVGGDIFKKKLFDKIKSSLDVEKIINIYGPTECTINATLYQCESDFSRDTIPIGKPLINYSTVILDKYNTPVSVGIPGELCISGDGLARGYLNSPDLTREKFTENPLSPGEIMYRTGDLAEWHEDGSIEYLGRIDRQVKMNGIRIELGEIENCLLAYEPVKEALVTDIEVGSRKKCLCAYLILNRKASVSDLREYLLGKIPGYMIPQYFIELDSFPLNLNGKVNIQSLPKPEIAAQPEASAGAATNETEGKLIEALCKLLGTSNMSISDSLFEHGLDSLKIVSLITLVKREFNVDISYEQIYKAPTVQCISNFIIECQDEENRISDNLILLAKGFNKNKHIFLVHAGSGEIGAYRELCSNLEKEFNYWGIRLTGFDDLSPKNINISDFAAKYINMIEKIQQTGPYYIMGWCIGGTIAFEMARLLEANNEKINFLGLINTIPPMFWEDIEEFDIRSEKAFLSKYFNLQEIENEISRFDNLKDVWSFVLDYLEAKKMKHLLQETLKSKVPASVINAIPKFEELSLRDIVYYFNVIRTLHNSRAKYFPSSKVDTQVHFIKSTEDEVVHDEEMWNKYCTNSIKVYRAKGGHTSMFAHPNINDLSSRLNTILSKGSVIAF